ncbi:MAG: Asp23/Gls24 family envelope stress response protein [Clostridiales Family XIII bacterium]|jgi:uncharacterized alkaline shock family protein YloU|nr:Asp23/Gls24 family envelope stress response protein [Clostridiales Family XIII bacterium]
MKVYALVGKSGTGKSFQAINLCNDMGIDAIIDDGLLIVNGAIRAGTSAKKQQTMMAAIKTALFTKNEHREEVRDAIRRINPDKLLVIGTSDNMIDKIKEKLGVTEPDERIYIDDITTAEEREIARHHRQNLGQHIVPAPTIQVKKHFSGYFVHPIKSLRNLGLGSIGSGLVKRQLEKTVVRPTFSYLGDYSISESAISDIIRSVARREAYVNQIKILEINNAQDGISIKIGIAISFGYNIIEISKSLQRHIAESIDRITALYVLNIDIEIAALTYLQP